eukprot:TRINITY_DN13002_c0_g1_i1.p1 TRINITY_DN13002_c0_g1~~TRINITY_DN13002_c0_g1_i1.p1  ORF type:complete len:177 (-),score=12.98 TRINITY_DN13002_c0_g1_i1:34-564(-)
MFNIRLIPSTTHQHPICIHEPYHSHNPCIHEYYNRTIHNTSVLLFNSNHNNCHKALTFDPHAQRSNAYYPHYTSEYGRQPVRYDLPHESDVQFRQTAPPEHYQQHPSLQMHHAQSRPHMPQQFQHQQSQFYPVNSDSRTQEYCMNFNSESQNGGELADSRRKSVPESSPEAVYARA